MEVQVKSVLKPLVKRREVQFKNLFKYSRGKVARQTFVNYLQRAVNEGKVVKREAGRTTYYQFNLDISGPEDETLKEWLDFAKQKLPYIPEDIKLA